MFLVRHMEARIGSIKTLSLCKGPMLRFMIMGRLQVSKGLGMLLGLRIPG